NLEIPFTVLRDVDLQVSLPPRLRRFIHEVDLGANEKVIAGFAERVWRQADGFVKEASTDLGFSAVWEPTQRQPTREDGALTFFVGGREVQAVQAGSAQEQLARLLPQFARFIPGAEDA